MFLGDVYRRLQFCLFQPVDQLVEIVVAIKFDFDFAFTPEFFNRYFCAEMPGQILGHARQKYLFGTFFGWVRLFDACFQTPDQFFGF